MKLSSGKESMCRRGGANSSPADLAEERENIVQPLWLYRLEGPQE